MDKLYHIGIDGSHGAKIALLPGDPGRVEFIAAELRNPRFLGRNREYTSWLGELPCGETALVMSTGMGGPSAAICAEELYMSGIRDIIRIGTCGGMDISVTGGDLVIATGSVRMEGTTREYLPIEFPAVADLSVTNALCNAAEQAGFRYHHGVVQSKDSFYGQHAPERMPMGYELQNKWQAYLKGHCLASEMESAALFIVSQILGIRCGCVLNVLWNKDRQHAGLPDTEYHDMNRALTTAINAADTLARARK